MPRTARIIVPDLPYHITQRGNYRQDIFQDNEEEVEGIRKHTLLGRSLGTKEFITKLGKRIGMVLSVLPRGRPKKQRSNK